MRRPELVRRALVLALVCASALVPLRVARAGLGSLYTELVCREISDVPKAFDFATSFVGLVNCDRLCLDAFLVCKRDVDEAASCQVAFANDWIAFDSRLDCNGKSGSVLSDCKAGWAADKSSGKTRSRATSSPGASAAGRSWMAVRQLLRTLTRRQQTPATRSSRRRRRKVNAR